MVGIVLIRLGRYVAVFAVFYILDTVHIGFGHNSCRTYKVLKVL